VKVEERLTRVLDGEPAGEPDPELAALLHTAAYLRESLAQTPAPAGFRADLLDWLLQPRRRSWWRRLLEPVERRVPEGARRPALGAAIGAGAVAAVVVGVIVLRSRRPAVASPA
jgi:hypothetical protein